MKQHKHKKSSSHTLCIYCGKDMKQDDYSFYYHPDPQTVQNYWIINSNKTSMASGGSPNSTTLKPTHATINWNVTTT